MVKECKIYPYFPEISTLASFRQKTFPTFSNFKKIFVVTFVKVIEIYLKIASVVNFEKLKQDL